MGKIYGKLFLVRSWKKYIVVVLLVLIQCRLFQNNAEFFGKLAKKAYELSVGDYIINFFKGTLPYTTFGDDIPFNIPAIWSLYFIYYFLIVARNVSLASQQYEQQLMMRCVFRKRWWRYQNLVIWMETVCYLMVTYLTFIIYGAVSGAKIFGITKELPLQPNGLNVSGISGADIILKLIVLSFFVTLAITYIQYIVSLWLNAIIGVIVPVVILVSSVFYMNPLFLFNYLMVIRSKELMAGGMAIWGGLIITSVIIVIMSFAGRKLTENKDRF